MKLSVYKPEAFPELERAAERLGLPALTIRPFVDWYYAGHETCKLWLLRQADGEIVGTIGIDVVRFEYEGRPVHLGFGSNFRAVKSGAGGLLFLQWLKTCPIGAVYGGTETTHKIIGSQNWTYFSGAKTYFLNRGLASHSGEPLKRRFLKAAIKAVSRPMNVEKRLARLAGALNERVVVHEEAIFSDDLLPKTSPFRFRCAPQPEYLRWRYDTNLPFARYRIFRLTSEGRTSGYVITHETEKRISVAQSDGDDAVDLAYGTILALARVARGSGTREILLTSSNAVMQKIYSGFGFRPLRNERPFALGSLRGAIDFELDTSDWLFNYDWTDNCLRPPFIRYG